MGHDYAADDHFQKYASSLTLSIDRYGPQAPSRRARYEEQKRQYEALIQYEREFREGLIAHENGLQVYEAFIKYICDEKHNILAARPFFRERQKVFTSRISSALKKRHIATMYAFHFNYTFIIFALGAVEWDQNDPLVDSARKARDVRTEIITRNLPLAISRARIFYSRTPKSHLQYMDLNQIASEGLMSAVDKYDGPFTKSFVSVATGRMHGNFIEQYSATPIHFYPVDKRKIYRANKLMRKYLAGGNGESVDFEKLAEEVNKEAKEPGHRTNGSEIADLLAAASCVSADTGFVTNDGEGHDTSPVERTSAPSSCRPDVQFEEAEVGKAFESALSRLSPFDRKLLRLRGVSL